MANDVYKQLQQRLDTYSVGFPATESGVEIEILKYLFTEDDARLVLQMTHKVETPEEIAPRVGKPVDELAEQLERMAAAGLLFRLAKDGVKRYGAIPFIHGLFEFQVQRMSRELGELMERYFTEAAFEETMTTSVPAFLRPIPVQQAVPVQHNVASFDDAVALLRQAKQIVITECVCRKQKNSIDQGCGKLLEACFMFGSMGQYYLDHGMGRKITVEEGVEILKKAQEDGLVNQPGHGPESGGHVQLLRRLLRRTTHPQKNAQPRRGRLLQPLRGDRRPGMHRLRDLPGPLPDGGYFHQRRRCGPDQAGALHRLRPVRNHLPHRGHHPGGQSRRQICRTAQNLGRADGPHGQDS